MTRPSPPDLLVLHALRLKGVAERSAVVARFALDRDETEELLGDFEAYGWAFRTEFAGSGGWTLTEAGRLEGERRLARELEEAGARAAVADVHTEFLPLNARFQDACTRWQLRPVPGDDLAANDHTDFRWDDRVLAELGALGRRLDPLVARLADGLARFDGYADRYTAALSRAVAGDHRWVDGLGRDSCHAVWFELHEDLLATLGVERGQEPPVPSG
ncbi:MAG: transcriptional regulator [Nocardioidaceae bacterium]